MPASISERISALRRDPRVEVAAVVLACLAIWALRRPQQITSPYVWVEESYVLRNLVEDGWTAIVEPLQGYVVLPASLLITIAAQISWIHLPALMSLFAALVFAGTVLLLVVPDSRWGDRRVRSAMALTAALSPANPEVFGVLLYSFWWTTLWPLIVLGWRRTLWGLRAPALLIASFSSPAGGALFALFAIEWVRERRARDAISAALLFPGFVVQTILVMTSDRYGATTGQILEQFLRTGAQYVTYWLARPDRSFLAFGGIVFFGFLLIVSARVAVTAKRFEPLLLTLAALGFTLLSSAPVPLRTDPALAGPRYYFLPYVAFAWVLILFAREYGLGSIRTAAIVLLGLSLLNLPATFSRSPATTAARLSWERELRNCAASRARSVAVPIYFDGSATYWKLDLTPQRCRDMVG